MDPRMSRALNQHTVPERRSSLSRSPTKQTANQTAVPERTSSLTRSPTKRPASPSEPIEKLLEEREQSNRDLKEARKRVKLSTSFDAVYWSKRCDVVRRELHSTKLTKKISMANMEDKTLDYLMTEQGQRLLQQEKTLKMEAHLYERQREEMSNPSQARIVRKAFFELFVGAKNGLGISNSTGPRDNSKQSNLRVDLISKMNPNSEEENGLWCPITKEYWPSGSMQAGHFFPWKHGQDTMNAIFGQSNDNSELMKAENAILWFEEAEQRFSNRQFVIIPDIPDNSDQGQVERWEASSIRDYKIRILNPQSKTMSAKILRTDKRWNDLDGTKVEFRSDWRPRARYIYFSYCCAMVAEALAGRHLMVSKNELGTPYWGTRGRYMPKSMLLGFVENLGHGYEHLLGGAIEEADVEAGSDPSGMAVATGDMKDTLSKYNDNEEEEEEDEEEDEDEDEGEDEKNNSTF